MKNSAVLVHPTVRAPKLKLYIFVSLAMLVALSVCIYIVGYADSLFKLHKTSEITRANTTEPKTISAQGNGSICRCVHLSAQSLVLNKLHQSKTCILEKPLFCTQVTVTAILNDAHLLVSRPIRVVTAYLQNILKEVHSLVLNFETGFCPSEFDSLTHVDNSSWANKQSPSLSFTTGSILWWQVLLNSVGVVLQNPKVGSRLCSLHATQVSSLKCKNSCLRSQSNTEQLSSSLVDTLGNGVRLSKHYASCAVVMNGGVLGAVRAPYLGPLIDSHPFVIRINYAPAGGAFAAYSGTKTHVRIGSDTVTKRHLAKSLNNTMRRSDDFSFMTLPNAFRRNVHMCIGAHASTGLAAVALALNMCDRVIVFGKVIGTVLPTMTDSYFDHHYYNPHDRPNHVHNWTAELDFFKKLQNQQCVSFVT